MTTFRKVIITFYMLLVAVSVAVPLLDGLGVITLKSGTSWLIAQIVTATAIPVSIAAFRTKDFFREDPHDVARLKKEYLAALAAKDEAHAQEVESVKDSYAALALAEKKEKLNLARELAIIRTRPRTVPGAVISAEEFEKRHPDE